jgi:hypothetical protein
MFPILTLLEHTVLVTCIQGEKKKSKNANAVLFNVHSNDNLEWEHIILRPCTSAKHRLSSASFSRWFSSRG